MERKKSLRLIVVLLVLNLAVSCGIVVYLASGQGDAPEEAPAAADGTLSFETVAAGKFVLYIGLNDKDTYTQLIPTEEAIATVNEIASRHVDGYTMQDASGGWVDETGTLTQEPSLVYSFDQAAEADIIAIMDEVLAVLNQNSILVEKEDLTYTYYDGGK